jgi:ribosomal protein S18 acetylase RimI-like enzyme
MAQFNIRPIVTDEDISVLRAINEEIQLQHFPAIIGEAQTRYMLETLFTPERVSKNIDAGEKFFMMDDTSGLLAGYFSYVLKPEENKIKLSRVFIKESARGLGLFNYAFNHIARVGREHGLLKVFLTVNRKNAIAIAAYEKKGFIKTDEAKFDIGNGYVMDDFIFEYKL